MSTSRTPDLILSRHQEVNLSLRPRYSDPTMVDPGEIVMKIVVGPPDTRFHVPVHDHEPGETDVEDSVSLVVTSVDILSLCWTEWPT